RDRIRRARPTRRAIGGAVTVRPRSVRDERRRRNVSTTGNAVLWSGSRRRGGLVVERTVLGCSGSYGAPAGGACSGYVVRAGDAVIWMDCGNGTFANLQQHVNPADITAVVITHGHPDHCVDIYGLHIMYKYGLQMNGLPVYAPEGL